MPINWQDGSSGGTPLSAANLNRLAVVADIGTAGTPTGDAVKTAAQVTDAKMAAALGSAAATAVASRPELKAALVPRSPNSLVLLGDSITAAVSVNGGTSLYYGGRGYWTWAATRLRHRLQLLNNAGVSGNTLQQIQARIATDVLPYSPGWVLVEGGTNNLATTDSAGDIQTLLGAIWDTLSAAGCRVIATTLPPRNGLTSDQQTKLLTVNEWIKAQGRIRPGLVVVDWFATLVDPTTACNYTAAYTYDGTHPTTPGAARMGAVLAATLDPLVPKVDTLPCSATSPGVLTVNPYQTGTTGGLANGATGTAPTNWTASPVNGSGSVVASLVARTDGYAGNWAQLVASSAANGAKLYGTNTAVGTAWNVGDQVYAWCEYQTGADWASVTQFRLALLCMNSAFQSLMAAYDLNWQSGDTFDPAMQPTSGVLRTPVITIPTGTNLRLQLEAQFQGIGTVQIGRTGISKVV